MKRRKNLRRPWTQDENERLLGYVARGRSLTTAMGTVSVRLNRTRAACLKQYYRVRNGEQTSLAKAEAPKAKVETFDGPIRVKFDKEFNNVTIKDGILHLS